MSWEGGALGAPQFQGLQVKLAQNLIGISIFGDIVCQQSLVDVCFWFDDQTRFHLDTVGSRSHTSKPPSFGK
jgi:hypothetical protein